VKAVRGAARAEIVPAQFLRQFLPAMDDAVTALNLGFGREPLATLAAWLVEKSWCSRQFSFQMDLPVTSRKGSCLFDISLFFVSSV
jgi:hypothetical protein